jgi:hypothetical protein
MMTVILNLFEGVLFIVRANIHKVSALRFTEAIMNVNKVLKTMKGMFTITSFTTGSGSS